MQIKTTLSISEARKQLFTIADKVQQAEAYYTLTERGKPTVVILSASSFESLQQKQTGSPPESATTWIVREASTRQCQVTKDTFREKNLLRSGLFVALTEQFGYPFGSIDIGRWVPKGGSGSRTYIESDLLVDEQNGTLIVCAVEIFQRYAENTQETLEELFAITATFPQQSHQSRFILYATRAPVSTGSTPTAQQNTWLIIDTKKYPSLEVWQQAGSPTEKSLPKYRATDNH